VLKGREYRGTQDAEIDGELRRQNDDYGASEPLSAGCGVQAKTLLVAAIFINLVWETSVKTAVGAKRHFFPGYMCRGYTPGHFPAAHEVGAGDRTRGCMVDIREVKNIFIYMLTSLVVHIP